MKRVLLRWMAANPLENFGDMLHDSYPFLLAFNATWTKGLTERSGSCSARWRLFLANLKSRVEQGITRGVVGFPGGLIEVAIAARGSAAVDSSSES